MAAIEKLPNVGRPTINGWALRRALRVRQQPQVRFSDKHLFDAQP
jgi:hypothetical protein